MDSRLRGPRKEKIIVNNNVIELNEANFDQEMLSATQPVLVEFWAGWSDPCTGVAPKLESVAEDEAVPVKVVRVNVEHHEKLTEPISSRPNATISEPKRASAAMPRGLFIRIGKRNETDESE